MMTGNHRHKVTISLSGEARAWKKVAPQFFHDSQVGSDDAEGVGSVVGAERDGRFLLEFRQADGALGYVVVEGRSRVNEETQHVVALFTQASQLVGVRRLFNLPTPPWRGMYCRSD
jgi:hypothetical protein